MNAPQPVAVGELPELPELPEAVAWEFRATDPNDAMSRRWHRYGDGCDAETRAELAFRYEFRPLYYTADQMRAYGQACATAKLAEVEGLVGKWREAADWIVMAFPDFSAPRVAEVDLLRKCADELAAALAQGETP